MGLPNNRLSREDHERLLEIKDEMLALLEEAWYLVKTTSEKDRAKAYWHAHIQTALTKDHGYLGSSMCCMEDSINALEPDEDDEDEEAEEDQE